MRLALAFVAERGHVRHRDRPGQPDAAPGDTLEVDVGTLGSCISDSTAVVFTLACRAETAP